MSSLKAEIAKVKIGFLEIEGLMDETGKYYVGVPQIADLLGMPRNKASRDIKRLLSDDIEYIQLHNSQYNRSITNYLSLEDFKYLLDILVANKNLRACEVLYGSESPKYKRISKKRASIKNIEKEKQEKLAAKLGGECEIATLAGRIDILTGTEIIEVKLVSNWKEAIGQILVYGSYYPSHKKRIHLFGETQESYLELIINHCKSFNITVTWER